MKIVIYKSDDNVPFETAYDQLGSIDKIIFSNRSEKVTDFNKKGVGDLKHLVEPWLPKRSVIGSQEEDTIFYIPFEIKEKFMEILENWIDGFKKIMMGKGKEDSVPTSQEFGLGKESPLASFYDEVKIQEVVTMSREDTKKELEKLFNSISDDDNEIDAILVCTYDGTKMNVQCSSAKKADRTVDIDSYSIQLRDLVSLLSKTGKVNPKIGSLNHVVFQYSGGIIHISHLPEHGDYTFLIFVSATKEGIEMLEFYRKRNLEEIQRHLKDLFA